MFDWHQYICMRLRWKRVGDEAVPRRGLLRWIGLLQMPFCDWLYRRG